MPPVPRHLLSTSAMLAFVRTGPIEELLKYFVPREADRKYLARCLLDSGPSHHRGANFVLLALLAKVLEKLPTQESRNAPVCEQTSAVPVPIRLPPHLAESSEERYYPLCLSPGVLHLLDGANEQSVAAMVDCLVDGPPQHALANALMVNVLERILASFPSDKA